MQNTFSVSGVWNAQPDPAAIGAWALQLRSKLGDQKITLGLIFMSPRYFDAAAEILKAIREAACIPLLIGCSGNSLIEGEHEIEDESALSLALYSLPQTTVEAFRFQQEQVEEANGPGYWRMETGLEPELINGWLAFADPFSIDVERWLELWNEAFPNPPTFGGLASGDYAARRTQLYMNNEVHESGGIAISFQGRVQLDGVISQGCTPIGQSHVITKTDRNLILQIGNRPAYQVLHETLAALSPEEQNKSRGNLFIGLAMNEYQDEFQRGDFLVRNILGADSDTGAVAIGAIPRSGQTIQFQRRDAEASHEDMVVLLRRAQNRLMNRKVYGACLCSCNGRGFRLFGKIHHDAHHSQEAFGPMGLAGFFCNGEIGPVGDHTYVHGYTASLALFVDRP